ncbi:lactonase family protein [Rhizobium jaguaris]|uniref:Lactonase family protein n=1 Tax=Rhizobium jaguaris TaxID=1312183 RepID=A0A387FXI0_9HYPH|nr:lactonase family protein [Rhizobium jaguaris]AYG63389.1 lactonase family protein [Rhizobium jaguaris]
MGMQFLVFVGTLNREAPYFQGARGEGLSAYRFDEETLAIEKLANAPEIENPTFLSVAAGGNHIYANSEVFGWKEGLVTAFRFDRDAGTLTYINTQPTLGSITAQNTVTRDDRRLLLVNYAMGSSGPDQAVVVYGLRDDGGLTPPLASAARTGTGPNNERQERSHAHSVTQIAEDIVIVADLGTDSLASYRLTREGALEPLTETKTAPGSGPRHVALHPNGRFLFVMNELDSTVASYAINAADGPLTLCDVQPAVPAEARSQNHCADIQISPDGRFVYGSNRGHDSIVAFEADPEDGKLSLVNFFPCGGITPRNLALTPSGWHLFCANQNSDRISIFERNIATGALSDTGHAIEVGTPMCVRIIR